jgi:hypothetical protein
MSSPIIDSSKWTPSASWSENLTNNTMHLLKNKHGETIWKPYFNPFANKLPSYELDFGSNQIFDYINGLDPWGRPFVKSIFFMTRDNKTPQRTALWKIQCGAGVPNYLEIAFNKSRVYKNFRLIGFTTVNGEVVRLYITNVNSDSLDKMASSFSKTSNFIEHKKANYIDNTVDDERPVPLWIV